MKEKKSNAEAVLIVGNGNLTYSIATCLVQAKYNIDLCTNDVNEAIGIILAHFSDIEKENGKAAIDTDKLKVTERLKETGQYGLAIVITAEDLDIKKDTIRQIENEVSADIAIAINTESIGLDAIQQGAIHSERIIGLNWTEPVHTTHFLEIITNPSVRKGLPDQMNNLGKTWDKDPYTVENFGIRSRLLSAMVREAFYLVKNGYASREDIDRACRNDAGYYLPFAGNCRYMDLMGTYAYGMVMKDLNPDLSKEQELPEFFTDIVKKGGLGIENGKGLYDYTPNEIRAWRKIFNEFSYKIEEIINKYPFNYKKKIS